MTRPGKGAGAPATVTQVRTWVYDSNQRLYSVVHPESGTTLKPSVRYNYNADGSVQWKMDAKDQKTVYTYDADGRVSVTQRYLTGGSEDTCAKVEYFYNSQTFDATFSQNATGRLAATATGCTTSGAGKLVEMYSYNAAGAVVTKRLRIMRGSGTVDKDVAYTYGTDGKLATVLHPGTTVPYTYSYDLMDRPIKMTGPPTLLGTTTADLVKDVNYGVAGQVTSMKYMQWQDSGAVNYFTENRTYNSLFQLTRQETAGATAAADIEYSYTASGSTLNDGRIVSRKNNMRNGASGETVTYNYDELNRVTQASSSVGWAQSFDYDGFGNMWTASMAGGTATPFNATYSQTTSTNRIATAGWGYDDNGNTTAMPVTGGYASLAYDVDNRLKTWTGPAGTEEYGYLADNKRVWKKSPAGVETIYFYGVGGQKLLTYTLQTSPLALVAPSENVYFGGKLIRADGQSMVHDRLGSVVARGDLSSSSLTKHDYLPYGEEMGTPTSGNVSKFGTYLRDQTTGLDYADQRFYGGTAGRFLTADPYEASGGASAPVSWNRYSYVRGDVVNRGDPQGLKDVDYPNGCGMPESDFCVDDGSGAAGGTDVPGYGWAPGLWNIYSFMSSTGGPSLPRPPNPAGLTLGSLLDVLFNSARERNSPAEHIPTTIVWLSDDCSPTSRPGDQTITGNALRRVKYQVLDQDGKPWNASFGDITITEVVRPAADSVAKVVGNSSWSSRSRAISSTGIFTDELSIGGLDRTSSTGTSQQFFYATGAFGAPQILNIVGPWTTRRYNTIDFSGSNVVLNGTSPEGGCK